MLWAGQIFLAFIFLYSGINKSIFSEKQLIARGQTGVIGRSAAIIRFIGICEILGSIGLVLPWLLNIMPFLTPLAALCFIVVMILAARIHYRLKERRNMVVNLLLLAVSIFVAWGRS